MLCSMELINISWISEQLLTTDTTYFFSFKQSQRNGWLPAFKREKKPSELENAEIVEGDIYYFYDADENLKLITDVFIEEEVHVVARSSEFQAAIILYAVPYWIAFTFLSQFSINSVARKFLM